jgi:hypothetical protein
VIFGPKMDEVTKGLKKCHNEELHNLYTSPDTVRLVKKGGMRWGGGRCSVQVGDDEFVKNCGWKA